MLCKIRDGIVEIYGFNGNNQWELLLSDNEKEIFQSKVPELQKEMVERGAIESVSRYGKENRDRQGFPKKIVRQQIFVKSGDRVEKFWNGGCGIGAMIFKFDSTQGT